MVHLKAQGHRGLVLGMLSVSLRHAYWWISVLGLVVDLFAFFFTLAVSSISGRNKCD